MADKLKIAVLYDVWGEEETPESEKPAESGRKRKEKEDRVHELSKVYRNTSAQNRRKVFTRRLSRGVGLSSQ